MKSVDIIYILMLDPSCRKFYDIEENSVQETSVKNGSVKRKYHELLTPRPENTIYSPRRGDSMGSSMRSRLPNTLVRIDGHEYTILKFNKKERFGGSNKKRKTQKKKKKKNQ
jgi:hypothetical protein